MAGAQGAGSQAPTGSTLGAGPDAPVNVVPVAGHTMPEVCHSWHCICLTNHAVLAFNYFPSLCTATVMCTFDARLNHLVGASLAFAAMPSSDQAVVPVQNPTAQDKAKMKTAATVAGVQEDLKGLRDRLTGTQVMIAGMCQQSPCSQSHLTVYSKACMDPMKLFHPAATQDGGSWLIRQHIARAVCIRRQCIL